MRESYNIGCNKCKTCKVEYLIEEDEAWNYSYCKPCRDKQNIEWFRRHNHKFDDYIKKNPYKGKKV